MRFIVGYDVSESLAVEEAMRALNMAIRQAKRPLCGLIHHSDHGIQYTCQAYRQRLKRYHIQSSMGEVGNCYDNAMAERVNGILKSEYLLGQRFADTKQARQATRQAIPALQR
ncbi:MAG: DDE-type integrase/transposase/recombinase [Chloroflexota bacterium]